MRRARCSGATTPTRCPTAACTASTRPAPLKDNAITVASFMDPVMKMPNGKEQPYLAYNPYGKGKVVWLGSGEMWRLRSYRESWHDRFWVKLTRFIGSGSTNAVNRRITPVMSRFGTSTRCRSSTPSSNAQQAGPCRQHEEGRPAGVDRNFAAGRVGTARRPRPRLRRRIPRWKARRGTSWPPRPRTTRRR